MRFEDIPDASREVVVLSGGAGPLAECERVLKPGGLLFLYGQPGELPAWGVTCGQMIFKYWIALDIRAAPRARFLTPTHMGLLMFHKPGAPLGLDRDAVRVPHALCAACGRTLKDWGGKKHLMNPRGTALSDVWRELPRRRLRPRIVPADVLDRIRRLTGHEPFCVTHD